MITLQTTAVDAVSYFLREPRDRVRHLWKSNLSFLERIESRRNEIQTPAALASIERSLSFPQRADYLALQKFDSRPRIIASYHYGDFVYGLNYLMSLNDSGLPRLVYSHKKSSSSYFQNMKNLFGDCAVVPDSQILQGDSTALELSSMLRKPGSNLVMFCDLPTGFGRRGEVAFLGRKAWFPIGCAVLAVVNNVPVLPVITISRENKNEILLGQQLEPRDLPGETKNVAIQRISQQLVTYFEKYFRNWPQQWRYLQALPAYFHEEGQSTVS